ncbi:MAG: hypothetical protein ACLPVO_00990 [Desulfomonilaceae bacterium]
MKTKTSKPGLCGGLAISVVFGPVPGSAGMVRLWPRKDHPYGPLQGPRWAKTVSHVNGCSINSYCLGMGSFVFSLILGLGEIS